jgi:HEPN domain
MLTPTQLKAIADARIDDAQALFSAGRYDGAVYLCGYAVEVALKHRSRSTMNTVTKTLFQLGRDAAKARQLRFFGLFRPFGSRKWDILVSGAGLRNDDIKAWSFLSEQLRSLPRDVYERSVDRTTVINEDDPRLAEVERLAETHSNPLRDFRFGDVEVEEAYIVPVTTEPTAIRP